MLSYTHLTPDERKILQQLLGEGYSYRRIAVFLGRSPSTISREVKRNRAKFRPKGTIHNPQWYNCWRAQNLYICRRRSRAGSAIPEGSEAWNYVLEKLAEYWSPEAICGRWRLEHPEAKPLHYSTIYRYIARTVFPEISRETHLRRRGKRVQTRNANYNTIQPDRIIPEWPEEIRLRRRIGDWEGDTVYGGVGKGLLVTLVDRKSRFLCAGLLAKRNSLLTKNTLVKALRDLPVESISLDNGSEFSEFHEMEKELNAPVYFAEPHKPWQRGTNENTNGLLRFYFPKGCDFHSVTQDELDAVVRQINSRPRKCLGWRTPLEVFSSSCVALH